MSLVETVEDAERYQPADPDNLGYVTQTTLSVDDMKDVLAKLKERFPNLQDPAAESICYATTNRQEAVKLASPGCDLFLIVGSPNSSNSRRLVEVALKSGARNAELVQRASEIDWDAYGPLATVGLSAGASAPEVVVNEIIDAFRERYDATVELAEMAEENEHFPVNRELRKIELTAADMAFVNGE